MTTNASSLVGRYLVMFDEDENITGFGWVEDHVYDELFFCMIASDGGDTYVGRVLDMYDASHDEWLFFSTKEDYTQYLESAGVDAPARL